MTKLLKLLLLLISLPTLGQGKFWVKGDFLSVTSLLSIEPVFCSQWLNQCSYFLDEEQKQLLQDRDYQISPVLQYEKSRNTDISKLLFGFPLEQIGADAYIKAGLTGKNVKIGIIDGGFLDANKFASLSHFFTKKMIAAYRDYITPEMKPYTGSKALDDVHGTEVWQLIGGFDKSKNIQFGLATDAIFYLARTDHGAYEKRLEEDLLIEAMEWMEKEGVRLINLSLGYGKGYDNPKENYTPDQMDGITSSLAKAVDTAFYKKNMLIVVAAGNEAIDPTWKYLVTPGDAKGALTVGASKMNIWEKIDFSSTGTPSLPFMKPNISCFATQGTSFSTPVITGLAAGILQYDSTLSASEIKMIIEKSGNYYPFGNDYVGFGVPTCARVLSLLNGEQIEEADLQNVSKSSYTFKQKLKKNYIVVYHKKGDFKVIEREIIRPVSDRFKVRRFKDATQSTVLIDNKVTEIFWND